MWMSFMILQYLIGTIHFEWYSCFGSTGEASNVDEYLWLMGRALYKPIIEYCGGTEIGGGFVCGSLLQAQSLAAFSTPAMCCSLFILDDEGLPIVSTIYSTFELKYCLSQLSFFNMLVIYMKLSHTYDFITNVW